MNESKALAGLISLGANLEEAKKFIEYHKSNLWIWDAFETEAAQQISSGRTKLGAKELFERIRWLGGEKQHYEFKLSNNFTAYYARMFVLKYPQHRNIFTLKELKNAA